MVTFESQVQNLKYELLGKQYEWMWPAIVARLKLLALRARVKGESSQSLEELDAVVNVTY